MENKTYTSNSGEKVDVQSIGSFHLVNALIKNVILTTVEISEGAEVMKTPEIAEENVAVLKEEVLRRLTPKEE